MALEERLLAQGCLPLCGVDEAGRGPLAGPVVAAAVIMAVDCPLRGMVRDSKRLSPRKREQLFELISHSTQVSVGVGRLEAEDIDRMNILQASLAAMALAVSRLEEAPAIVLVDGNIAPPIEHECIPVVKGDVFEPSISAASIVAKVVRDRIMTDLDTVYPGYGFARHKGYPTTAHYKALQIMGPCPVHRRSFKGVTGEHACQGRAR